MLLMFNNTKLLFILHVNHQMETMNEEARENSRKRSQYGIIS